MILQSKHSTSGPAHLDPNAEHARLLEQLQGETDFEPPDADAPLAESFGFSCSDEDLSAASGDESDCPDESGVDKPMPESNLSPRPIDIPLSEVEQENEGSSDVGRSAFDDVPDISHDYTWTSLFGGTERVNADGSVEAKSLQLNAEDVESWIEAKALEEGVKYKLKDTRPSQNTKDSFLKSVRYVCHRAGTYESRSRGRRPSEVQIARESDEMVTASSSSSQFDPNESLAPQKRRPASNPVPFVKRPRPNQKESGKVACRASILIKYFKNNEMVEILHRPMHSNHGSECPVRLCHISKERKARILALLNAGLSRRMIAKRFSHDVTPEYIRKNGIQAARDNSITRLDVRVVSVILSSEWSMAMLVGFPQAENLHLVSCPLGNALCNDKSGWLTHIRKHLMRKDYYFTPDKEREWMRSYRQDIYWADVNTNNYVESWHNNLKSHFVKYNRHPRHDTLVYILVHDALSLCASDIYKTQLNLSQAV